MPGTRSLFPALFLSFSLIQAQKVRNSWAFFGYVSLACSFHASDHSGIGSWRPSGTRWGVPSAQGVCHWSYSREVVGALQVHCHVYSLSI